MQVRALILRVGLRKQPIRSQSKRQAKQRHESKHGMPPHGGFAMGLERWVARLVGAANVRETTLFPRDMQRLTP